MGVIEVCTGQFEKVLEETQGYLNIADANLQFIIYLFTASFKDSRYPEMHSKNEWMNECVYFLFSECP